MASPNDVVWDEAYLNKLSKAFVAYNIVLHPWRPAESSRLLRRQRGAALRRVAHALAMPLISLQQLKDIIKRFKELYVAKRAEVESTGGGLLAVPEWARAVEPYLRYLKVPKRLAHPEPVLKPEPEPEPDPAEQLLQALTERARFLRTVHGEKVCCEVARDSHLRVDLLLPVWERLVAAARTKLDALIAGGDAEEGLGEAARLSRGEWQLVDAMLLHDDSTALVQEEHARRAGPLRALIAVFHLVQLFHLEESSVQSKGEARDGWRAAALAYRRRGRVASAVLLQRRWHELKAMTRRVLCEAARGVAGGGNVAPLHLAVARRFPHIALAPLPSWRHLVDSRQVLENCDLTEEAVCASAGEAGEVPWGTSGVWEETEAEAGTGDAGDNAEDDLILVEQEIETIDLLATGDQSEEEEETVCNGSGERVVVKREVRDLEDARAALESRRQRVAAALQDELERQLHQLDEFPDDPSKHSPGIDPKLLMATVVPLIRVDDPGWRDILPRSPTAPPPSRAPPFFFEDDSTSSEGDDITNISITRVKSEVCEDAEESQSKQAGRKRVRLPDIAEVRRINSGMLTAQVAPLATRHKRGTPSTSLSEDDHFASGRSTPDGALCVDESGYEDGGGGENLTSAQLSALLRSFRNRPPNTEESWRTRYCCPARYHRALNDARRRARARGGRPQPTEVAVHAARCVPPCRCCCRLLLDAAARDAIAADRQRLLRDVRMLLGVETDCADERSSPVLTQPAPPPQSDQPPPRPTNRPRFAFKKKRPPNRSPPRTDPDLTPRDDPLQEWIRQKNITSRFFDLNLKKPPPAPKPTPAPVDPTPSYFTKKRILNITAPPPPGTPLTPISMRPSTASSKSIDFTVRVTSGAQSSGQSFMRVTTNGQEKPGQTNTPSPKQPLPRITPVNRPAPASAKGLQQKPKATKTAPQMLQAVVGPVGAQGKVPVNLIQAGSAPHMSIPNLTAAVSDANQSVTGTRVMPINALTPTPLRTVSVPAGLGAGLPQGAIPVTMVVQPGGGVQLVPVRLAPPPPPRLTGDVIDLSSDDSPPSSAPASPPPSTAPAPRTPPTPRQLLSRLPPGISVKRRETTPATTAAQRLLSALPPGIMVKRTGDTRGGAPAPAPRLLNDPVLPASQAPPTTLPGKGTNVKVFKITADGKLKPSGSVDGSGTTAAGPDSGAPLLGSGPSPLPRTKIVMIPRTSRSKLPPAATAPPRPATLTPRILNEGLDSPPQRIAELITSDGRRMVVMRRPEPLAAAGVVPPSADCPQYKMGVVPKKVPIPRITEPVVIRPIVKSKRPSAADKPATADACVFELTPPEPGAELHAADVTSPEPGAGVTSPEPGAGVTSAEPGAGVTSAEPGAVVTSAEPGANVTSTEPGANVTSAEPGANVTSTEPGANVTSAEPASGGSAKLMRLDGGATLRPVNKIYDFSDRTMRLEAWLRPVKDARAILQVTDRGRPYYYVKVGANEERYYVRTSRALPFRRAALWTTGPTDSRARLLLTAAPSLSCDDTVTCLTLPGGQRAQAQWVCRTAREVAIEAREGAHLWVVQANTGVAYPLTSARALRPGELALRCKFLAAAMIITRHVNEASKQPSTETRKMPGFVRIAPRPPVAHLSEEEPRSKLPRLDSASTPKPLTPPPLHRVTIIDIEEEPATVDDEPSLEEDKPSIVKEEPIETDYLPSAEQLQPADKNGNNGKEGESFANDRLASSSMSKLVGKSVSKEDAPSSPEEGSSLLVEMTAPKEDSSLLVEVGASEEIPPEPARRSSRRAAHDARAKLTHMMSQGGESGGKESREGGDGTGSGDEETGPQDYSEAAGLDADSDDDYNMAADMARERAPRRGRNKGRRRAFKGFDLEEISESHGKLREMTEEEGCEPVTGDGGSDMELDEMDYNQVIL